MPIKAITRSRAIQCLPIALTIIFFCLFFYYFFRLHRFHLLFLEQSHLFLFQSDFLTEHLAKPAGVSFYLAAFVAQLFISPAIAALVVTTIGFGIFGLAYNTFHKIGINSPLISLFYPVLLLFLFNSAQNHFATAIGLLLSLLFVQIFLKIANAKYQTIFSTAGIPFLIFACGAMGILASSTVAAYYLKKKESRIILLLTLTVTLLAPLLLAKYIYLYPLHSIITAPFRQPFNFQIVTSVAAALLILPVAILISPKTFSDSHSVTNHKQKFTLQIIQVTLPIILLGGFIRLTGNSRTEQILAIDYAVQNGNWHEVLSRSGSYPGNNRIVLYYTNLALYQTGQMGSRMFDFRQEGSNGLWLEWERNGITPLFGAEIYYHLNYINEAYRWAFEAMMAKGPSPRLLKRLVVTSIINEDYLVAEKYLNILENTLFYREWAHAKRKLIHSPQLAANDAEIGDKWKKRIHTDFIATENNKSGGLTALLTNQPDNRMAFEYLMATLLLNKDLKNFIDNIGRLKEFGFTEIPKHYEEALVTWMLTTKKDMTPNGFKLSETTTANFARYCELLMQHGQNRENAKKMLANQYGNTFWYYLNFSNISKN